MSSLRAYCTLPYLRTRQGLNVADVADDNKLLTKARASTAAVERYTGRVFEPVQETRTFDWQDPLQLYFRSMDLLSVTSVVDGAGATIPTAAFIMLGAAQSSNSAIGPFYGMRLNPTSGFFLFITTTVRAITVTGTWGWHDDYANAWHTSGVTLGGNIDASVTALTTSTNNNTIVDPWGQQMANDGPVQAGHLIQIDTEWMRVVRVISPTSITVVRGVNGSTAATHTSGATISIYEPPIDIREAAAIWGAYLYVSDSANFTKTVMPAMGQTIIPNQFPAQVYDMLKPYRRVRVG